MSLIITNNLPAAEQLREEGLNVLGSVPEGTLPLRVLFLNLMPCKEATELDILRSLSHTAVPVEVIPMKIAGQRYKTTPQAHMETYYTDFDRLEADSFDGLVVTGAPLEHLPFEDVRYWPQLCHIMDWARRHVRSTLYVCWGAQAGLYHHFGIPKHDLPAKRFGVFAQRVLSPVPLFEGLGEAFPMPNSRHTEVRRPDFPATDGLAIVAESDESGVGVALSRAGREIYIVGHLEYEPRTLENEYRRDLSKGLPIAMPEHYYRHDTPADGIDFSWRDAAIRFYTNWIERYVSPNQAG